MIQTSMNPQKVNLLSFRRTPDRDLGQAPEHSHFNSFWTPAFAGVTELGLFTKQSIIGILNFGHCNLFVICNLGFGI